MKPKAVERWLSMVAEKDYSSLAEILAEEVVFRSPVVSAPQTGRATVAKYLRNARRILGNSSFRYTQEWISPQSAALEFEVEVESLALNGIDILHWNADDKIVLFKVMVRPLKAVSALHQLMAQAMQGAM